MKLSEEMAVRLHRMMWSDMQKELGDNPEGKLRHSFKIEWIEKHFPGEHIENQCFLCEYVKQLTGQRVFIGCAGCRACPIKWPKDACCDFGIFGITCAPVHFLKSPIYDILALPTRKPEIAKNDEKDVVRSYYNYREELLSKASGISASLSIEDHVKAIQEKAVEEYFNSKPAAKLATMDVDQAFEQYAKEVKAPIFKALAEASGLSAGNDSVKAHISKIRAEAEFKGRHERNEEVFKSLSVYSGVSEGNWRVSDHVEAILVKERENFTSMKEANSHISSLLHKYKDRLSDTSGLERDRPVDDHVRAIFNNGFEAGKEQAKDLLLDKIEGILGTK